MQSDDTFRSRFETATAELTNWAEQQRDAAHVEHELTPDFWRVRLAPHAGNACPVEVILHRTTQKYDLQVGSESWEALRVSTLDDFVPLLGAIVSGCVVTRSFHSVSSHTLLRVETTIDAPGGPALCLDRKTTFGERLPAADAVIRDRHWLPYRRA